jgi:hypothetical protein
MTKLFFEIVRGVHLAHGSCNPEILLNRANTPEDVAELVAFRASNRAPAVADYAIDGVTILTMKITFFDAHNYSGFWTSRIRSFRGGEYHCLQTRK